MKYLKQVFVFTSILSLSIIFTACSSGTMGTTSQAEIEEGISRGEYVRLNLHSRNMITRGKNVFEAVMKKYQPVIDFYGADSTVFQALVNTSLTIEAKNLTQPSERLFNYDALKIWEDTDFVVEYDDGTKETLPSAEALVITGGNNPDWCRNGKKIVNYLVKLKKVNDVMGELSKWNAELQLPTDTFNSLIVCDKIDTIKNVINQTERMIQLSSMLTKIGKYSGYVSIAFDVAQITGIVNHGPSENEVVNMKLGHINQLLEGIYGNLKFIDTRLNQIEQTIRADAVKQRQLDLRKIMTDAKGIIDELNTTKSLEKKIKTAEVLRNLINSYLENYTDWSIEVYKDYVNYQMQYSDDKAEYLPIQFEINTPYMYGFMYDCIISKFALHNPNTQLPFTYEGLEFLKNLYRTRFSINSFDDKTDSDVIANNNSGFAKKYLANNDDSYIKKLRTSINKSYVLLKQELEKSKVNLTGKLSNTAKNNLAILIEKNNQTTICASCKAPNYYSIPGVTYSHPNYISDQYGFQPTFSLPPFVSGGYCDHRISEDPFVFGYYHSNDWYMVSYGNPSVKFKANLSNILLSDDTTVVNSPIELKKFVTDDNMLDDASTSIDIYYKAQTQKLLEFAASLAALEVQLALYLNDEDYKAYDPDYVQ